ncbi:hypothetical protein E4U22_001600 [Claviceps purpurea]|nr:hypothetical protein E4U37_004826 [Claviceps purpurea]KAG6218077.1 hypothetical protein E4U26_007696 [Claviceps purpurea]KAG6223779.1 hypothetical protein E4U34_000682 [Claviceps purpurea]KAG6250809.1 hypothetical protein E4U24_001510 [Claviceps purpurea]KAG6260214.1 hypothetical protein E4U49_005122 [Claviceps purpurea]
MRLLTALAFASGVLALATGPVQHPAGQQEVQGVASFNSEDAAVLVVPDIAPRDETVSSSALEKRTGYEATVPLPVVGNPRSVTIAGVIVTFIMAKRMVQRGGAEFAEFFVDKIMFKSQNPGFTKIQAIANGVTFLSRKIVKSFEATGEVPTGAEAFKLFVEQTNDEL